MFTSEDLQVIGSYGPGRFRIANVVYENSVLVFPERTVKWPVSTMSDVTMQSLALVVDAEPAVEVLLLGCGARMQLLQKELRNELRAAGIGVDSMDTGAACRTYNALLAEGRHAAAGLMLL